MDSVILIGVLSLVHLVVAQVTVVQSPSDVATCAGGTAEFFCAFQFASGTPSGATWFRNGNIDVSSASFHVVTDNSSDASSTPAIVSTRLLISNVTLAGIESGANYLCDESGVRSNPSTLTIISETPLENVVFGISSSIFGEPRSPDTLSFQLSYRSESAGNVSGIYLHWSTLSGPTIGSVTLDPSTTSYTIEGLSPDTTYNVTGFLVNVCGRGQRNSMTLMTGPLNGDRPSVSLPTTTTTTTTTVTTATITATMRVNMNPTSTVQTTPGERGSAVEIHCSILLLMVTTLMAVIIPTNN